jgi:CMP-N-acetylneuraminic acid synthetase
MERLWAGDVGNILSFVIPETQIQDIDTETDWEIAEMKYSRMQITEAK